MSILRPGYRLPDGGADMTTDTMIVDVSEDWAVACDVQERFMQHRQPMSHALSYTARCRQVRALGGDCYDFLPLSHSRLALAIGDASGKSLAGALMIASVQSSLRTAASFAGNDAAAVVRSVNAQVYASSLPDRYATLFYGVFDGETRRLQYVNGGHNPPLIMRDDGSTICLERGGAPLGMFPNWAYEEALVQLRPGDLVVAYTDGVTEALNSAGEEWGVEGLRKAVSQTASQSAEDIAGRIFTSMDEFSRGHQTDDATVLVARVI
jgi:sigma-B regulation protein RsbU (phosphoserine phosphatase)